MTAEALAFVVVVALIWAFVLTTVVREAKTPSPEGRVVPGNEWGPEYAELAERTWNEAIYLPAGDTSAPTETALRVAIMHAQGRTGVINGKALREAVRASQRAIRYGRAPRVAFREGLRRYWSLTRQRG